MSPVIPLLPTVSCGYSRMMQNVQPEQLAVFLAAIFAAIHKKTWGGSRRRQPTGSNQIRPNQTFESAGNQV
jgi:hypothetical protein